MIAKAPAVSVVMPAYNCEKYIEAAIRSVISQTFTDWECLCVDDGSADESGSILDEYAQRDSRFLVFPKKNGGVSAARNLALDNAKGEWICFLDGDDVWDVTFLSEIVKMLHGQKPDLVRIGYTRFSSREEMKKRISLMIKF